MISKHQVGSSILPIRTHNEMNETGTIMSRRIKRPLYLQPDGTTRRGLAGTDDYDAAKYQVAVGCTGRGSHKRITIATWDVLGDLALDGTTPLVGTNETFDEDAYLVFNTSGPEHYTHIPDDWRTEIPHLTQPIKCDYCERNMPVRMVKLYRRLRVLKAHDVAFLDLSALDAIAN
jgi:hypothetical protein